MHQRQNVQLRLSPQGVEKADALAAKHGLTRSDVLRACFVVAFRNERELDQALKSLKEQP